MIASKKRGKVEIYGDILEAIELESGREGGARLTRVQSRTNLAYDRFRKDLDALTERGLVSLADDREGVNLSVSDSGRAFLRHFREVRRFLESYGL